MINIDGGKFSIIFMKIVFLDTKTMGEVPNLEILKKLGDIIYYPITHPTETLNRLKEAYIAITCKVDIDKPLMEKLPVLKLICIAATGTNNIDLEFARIKGIQVKNVSGYSTNSVAQSTFSMILALLNHTAYFDNYVKSGNYSTNDTFTHIGRSIKELHGKNFGIIGLGSIGKKVAEIAEVFGCNIYYFSTSGKNKYHKYVQLTFEELLSISDIVSIHAPLNDATRNLVDYDKLRLMKPSAILINTGRGGIVNEADLAKSLNEGLIGGAGIDVFTKEPIAPDNPLLYIKEKEKIIFSPHSAWTSIEARKLLIEKIAENIRGFIEESRNKP